jgi:hypothetical protein
MQFPTTTILTLALAALTTAQSTLSTTTSIPLPDNPNTHLLTETDSNGVITGQATAATQIPTQPAVVTSQPLPASIYAGLPQGLNTVTINGNQTVTVSVSGTAYSVVTSTPTPSKTGGAGSGASGSAAASSSAGAGATAKAAVGAVVGVAGMFAALL